MKAAFIDYSGTTVHIGDSYQSDICGAKGAGIKGILVDRKNIWAYEDVITVNSLKECIKVLKECN